MRSNRTQLYSVRQLPRYRRYFFFFFIGSASTATNVDATPSSLHSRHGKLRSLFCTEHGVNYLLRKDFTQ